MSKYESAVQKRLIYRLPDGNWSLNKDDFVSTFKVGELPKGMIAGWSCSREEPKEFGKAELQKLHRFDLTASGMLKCLEMFGPFTYPFKKWGDVLKSGETLQGPAFASWWIDAIKIQRAYSLWNGIRSGRFFEWEAVRYGCALSFYRLLDWPKKLQMCKENDQGDFTLSFGDVSGVRRKRVKTEDGYTFQAAFTDEDGKVARTMAKLLLAQYINEGLRESSRDLGFAYDPSGDTFKTDVAETETVDLKLACWLVLRDLASGVSGRRFCRAPRCTKNISNKRKGSIVCSNTCQKRLETYKANEAIRMFQEGYTLDEIVEDLNSREFGKVTANQVNKWIGRASDEEAIQ